MLRINLFWPVFSIALVGSFLITELPAQTTRKKSSAEGTKSKSKTTKRTEPEEDEGGTARVKSRPKPEAMRIEKLSPELEQLLADWEAESSKIERLSGSFTVKRYNETFSVQELGTGTFEYQSPDRGLYYVEPVEIDSSMKSDKKNKQGESYELRPYKAERWICTGSEVYQIFDDRKEYNVVSIPEEARGENIIHTPLPFLIGIKAKQAKARYSMWINESKSNETRIWLDIIPKTMLDTQNYDKASVVLDRKRLLPIGLKYDKGTNQVVHYFDKTKFKINSSKSFFSRDAFKPNLSSYKKVMANANANKTAEKSDEEIRPQRYIREEDNESPIRKTPNQKSKKPNTRPRPTE